MRRITRIALIVFAAFLWSGFVAMSGVIFVNSLPYFSDLAGDSFVVEKGAVGETWWWRAALFVHVFAGLVCLFSVVLQFFRGVLRRFPWLHRWLGRVYAWSVLVVLVPTGMVLAPFAKGGLEGALGFMLNGMLAFVFTLKGVTAMRGKNVRAHVRWMIRSFAIISSALTFRLLHVFLFNSGMEYELNYILSIWISTLGNLLIAESILFFMTPEAKAGRRQQSPETAIDPNKHPVMK